MAVKLTLEHVPAEVAEDLDFDLIGEGVAALVCGLPEPNEIDLVLSGDFTASVRARMTAAEGRDEYSAERHIGLVPAKTFPGDGPKATVVMNAAIVWRKARDAIKDINVPRCFGHEGRHVALHQRGEHTHDARRRRNLMTAERVFVGRAGIMIEEYRVERALCAAGMPAGRLYIDSLSGSIPRIHAAMADAARARWNGGDIAPCIQAVLGAFDQLTTLLGYVAAHVAAEATPLDGVSATPEWERLVGSRWTRVQELLSAVPHADESWSADALVRGVDELAAELREWLEDIGFSLDDRDDGNCWFDFTRHDW